MSTRGPGSGQPTEQEAISDAIAEARAAFGSRAGGELASLVFDSLVDADDPPADHRLRFEHPRLAVDARIGNSSGRAHISLRTERSSPTKAVLQLHGADVALVALADRRTFEFDTATDSLARVAFEYDDAEVIRTDWFRL